MLIKMIELEKHRANLQAFQSGLSIQFYAKSLNIHTHTHCTQLDPTRFHFIVDKSTKTLFQPFKVFIHVFCGSIIH